MTSFLVIILISIRIRYHFQSRKQQDKKSSTASLLTIGFFHPNCSAFGGGERVLWKLIQALDELTFIEGNVHSTRKISIFIYTRDAYKPDYTSGSSYSFYVFFPLSYIHRSNRLSYIISFRSLIFKELLKLIEQRFSIVLSSNISLSFVHLYHEALYLQIGGDESKIRRSMIGESIQSMRFVWKALQKKTPDVFIDTTGYAFTFFIAKILAGCKVITYVHYPTIRYVDMIIQYIKHAIITAKKKHSFISLFLFVVSCGMYDLHVS